MRRSVTPAVLAAVVALPAAATAGDGNPVNAGSKNPLTLAVIGDTPYLADQIARFPALVEDVNGEPQGAPRAAPRRRQERQQPLHRRAPGALAGSV